MNWKLSDISIPLLALCALLSCCDTSRPTAIAPAPMTPENKNAMIELNREMVERENRQIETYIRRHRLPMQRFDDGYYGMITRHGEGIAATDSTILTLRATIRLLSGEVCYNDRIITFRPGNTAEISGLHRVAASLRKGARASFIFPPLLAYGIYGDGDKIPQRSILIYDIEVLNVAINPPKP
ncbi:MAG: FKBP-type peptidyl-prolyl cis-trans isomerase [Prevotellaceae bacterium]|jgi:FKBP-type peptidyl-prolyl cis-trans isomerase|nr:FKBP-type peptidyl-prolyl cis-trans isomerase [Prevotellaceae bacterium]